VNNLGCFSINCSLLRFVSTIEFIQGQQLCICVVAVDLAVPVCQLSGRGELSILRYVLSGKQYKGLMMVELS